MPRGARVTPSEDPAETRAWLLAVALECFDRYGIEKTTMDDIARAAGVSRPTVYRYLGDRTNVLLALIEQRARIVIAKTHKAISRHARFEDKLVEGILRSVQHARDDPYLGVLIAPTHLELAHSLIAANEMALMLNLELWQAILETAQANGEIRDGLAVREICEWLSEVEFIFVAREELVPRTTNALRRRIRTFIVPALVPNPTSD